MKKFILALLIAVTLSSCGTLQKTVHKTERDSTVSVSTNSISSTETHTQAEISTTRTITERTDTTIVQATNVNDIKIQLDHPRDTAYFDGDTKITEHFDTSRHALIIHAEYTPKPVTVYKTKTIYEQTKNKSEGDQEIKQAAKTNTNIEIVSKSKDKDVQRTSGLNLFWIGMLCGLLVALIYRILKLTYFKWLP